MKKKLILIAVIALTSLILSGCMSSGASAPELVIDPAHTDPAATDFEDNLDGLVKYLTGCQVLAGDGMDMSADFIGATVGKKYIFKNGESAVTCELYEFDLQNLNETATNTHTMIKDKGFFEILDKEVQAEISESGKFIMIYVNAKNDETQKAYSDKLHEKFRTFKGK